MEATIKTLVFMMVLCFCRGSMAGVAKKLLVLPNINNVKTVEPYKARVEQQVAPLGIIESVKEAVEPNNATELLSVRFSPVKKAYVVKMFMQQDAHIQHGRRQGGGADFIAHHGLGGSYVSRYVQGREEPRVG